VAPHVRAEVGGATAADELAALYVPLGEVGAEDEVEDAPVLASGRWPEGVR